MIPALSAVSGAIVLGLTIAPGTSTASVNCLASITLSSSHVRDIEAFVPRINLPKRDDLNLPDLSGYVLVLLPAVGEQPGSPPPRTIATAVDSHSYFRERFGPVVATPLTLEQIDFGQLTKPAKNGAEKLPAGMYRFCLVYLEGFSDTDGPAPATLCTVYSPAFSVDKDIVLWDVRGAVSSNRNEQPSNSISPTTGPVTPLACASVVPGRPARYALR